MRRVAVVVVAVCAAAGVWATPAGARAPTPTPGSPLPGGAGQAVCTISDSRLIELSGLVATSSGYAVVNDSNPVASAKRIFFLDSGCDYRGSAPAYSPEARDPEDLAMAPDGTLWVADIGDNETSVERRRTVALWKLAPGADAPPEIYRFTYPDGPHDAEALLLDGDGTPLIVTKEATRPAGIYRPTAAPVPDTTNGVALRRVGEFQPPPTQTSNPLGGVGRVVVTGGANSPDGKRVALRTYADAFEWDVPDGDVVKAITTGRPRVTALPDEPFGEAIAYSRDGRSFLTVSDSQQPTTLLRYTPAVGPAPAPTTGGAQPGSAGGWLDSLSLQDVTFLIAAVGLVGLLLVIVGVHGIRRSRQSRRDALAAMPVRATARVNNDGYDEPDDPRAPPSDPGRPGRGRWGSAPDHTDDTADYRTGQPRGDGGGQRGGSAGRYANGDHRRRNDRPGWGDHPGDYDDRQRGYSRR